MMKTCKICKVEFPKTLEYFSKSGKYFRSYCKPCDNEKAKTWNKNNLDQKRQSGKIYQKANFEKRYLDKKIWAKNNPDKVRGYSNKRRALKLGNEHTPYTEVEMLERYGTVCYLCNEEIDLQALRSCGAPGYENSLWRDHVLALTNGGPDMLDNVKPSHAVCNKLKGNKEIYENKMA
jgi:hypothetical protein